MSKKLIKNRFMSLLLLLVGIASLGIKNDSTFLIITFAMSSVLFINGEKYIG